jgi:hypothetical protein
MLFMNDQDGTVAVGNREPGNWLFSGPPSPDHLEPCDAGSSRCITGLSGFHPIIVGDFPQGARKAFPQLGIGVVHRTDQAGSCDRFESTPLISGSPSWSQTVVYCHGLGVVQVALKAGDHLPHRLDLKSAEGLFGTGLVLRESSR